MTHEESTKILDQAVSILQEHFDAVQVVVTWRNSDGGTVMRGYGNGNYYARKGAVSSWLLREDEGEAEEVAINAREEHEEDDE